MKNLKTHNVNKNGKHPPPQKKERGGKTTEHKIQPKNIVRRKICPETNIVKL